MSQSVNAPEDMTIDTGRTRLAFQVPNEVYDKFIRTFATRQERAWANEKVVGKLKELLRSRGVRL